MAGGGGRSGVWSLFCGAEVCRERRSDLAAGDFQNGELDGLFAGYWRDGFAEVCRGDEGSDDAPGSGVGDGGAGDGYFGELAVYRGDTGGAAGCCGGAGFAVSGINDFAGGVDAPGAAYAAAGTGDGGGGGG